MVTSPLIRRRDAVQATIDRFDGKPFKLGQYDCARMAAFCVRQQGYRVSMLKGGRYSTERSAMKMLKGLGATSMAEVLDQHFPRLDGPAFAWPGDLIEMASEHRIGAIAVAVGNGRILGFHEGACRVLEPVDMVTAWRTPA